LELALTVFAGFFAAGRFEAFAGFATVFFFVALGFRLGCAFAERREVFDAWAFVPAGLRFAAGFAAAFTSELRREVALAFVLRGGAAGRFTATFLAAGLDVAEVAARRCAGVGAGTAGRGLAAARGWGGTAAAPPAAGRSRK
jgi:hypothetical protein